MKILKTQIEDLLVVELDLYGDSRGFFVERFNENKFSELGLPTVFRQDNHSRSAPGVIRGLHFQHTPPQGKLVGVVKGRIWDVAVDIRPFSDTYGQHFGLELNEENAKLLWMPGGFAHGFCVLGDENADVFYKCTEVFNPTGEQGILWDDEDLKVQWPFEEMKLENGKPIISERDTKQMTFKDYSSNPAQWKKNAA